MHLLPPQKLPRVGKLAGTLREELLVPQLVGAPRPKHARRRAAAALREPPPLVSVLILNYNGTLWLERCLESLRRQTLFAQIEIIVADNASPDRSGTLAATLMQHWSNGHFVQLGANLGYSEGNNQAAAQARGQYLLFLNPDTWLEPDCLEQLVQAVRTAGATVAAPVVLHYENSALQSAGARGFDLFGLTCWRVGPVRRQPVLAANGCAFFIQADYFRQQDGFDNRFFMYADEDDLCWRVWLSGGKVVLAPSAKVHHRGAAVINPKGQQRIVEARTSDTKRFYANRNNLLMLLKNCQHLLLVLVLFQVLMLGAEGLVMAALTRRWSHFRRAYLEALLDCWRLRGHILVERRRLKKVRQHGDLWMLRFLCRRFNRWEELQRLWRLGLPKVDAG